ncbi:MAG: FKBP-type peptidyl-prolyl cis-trans isomerase [Treponemataceae bacterium]
MIIEKNKVVTLEYTLTDEKNEILDSSKDLGALDYLHGYKNIICGLENALEGKKVGDAFKVEVAPEDGYGLVQEELIIEVPRTQFDSETKIEVGMQFEAQNETGGQVVTVVDVTDETIKVDANHPLAGEKLFFDVEVTNIRDATEKEIADRDIENDYSCGCSNGGGCGGEGEGHHHHGHDHGEGGCCGGGEGKSGGCGCNGGCHN